MGTIRTAFPKITLDGSIINLEFRDVWVNINYADFYLQTVFKEDGSIVPARPDTSPESWRKAYRMGYSTVWEMTRDHEVLHTWWSYLKDGTYSPTLWRVAHQIDLNQGLGAEEEELILRLQSHLTRLNNSDDSWARTSAVLGLSSELGWWTIAYARLFHLFLHRLDRAIDLLRIASIGSKNDLSQQIQFEIDAWNIMADIADT
jgi:hypothetical protein